MAENIEKCGCLQRDRILKVKEYAEKGYTYAVVLDLSKYFRLDKDQLYDNIVQ